MRLIDADELSAMLQEEIEKAGKLIVENPADKLDQVANDTAKKENECVKAMKNAIHVL